MNIIPKNTNILHKQSLKLSDDVVGSLEENWLAETVKMAIRQGHCPIPMDSKKEQPAGKFKNGETYPLDHPRWKRADINIIGIRLDDFILLDLDLYKENATSQGEVLDIVGEHLLVQDNDKDNSPHYLYRVPVGYDKTTLKNSNVGWMPGVDLLTGNQLMHLQKHKTIIDGELPTLEQVPDAPQAILDALTKPTVQDRERRNSSPASNEKATEIVSWISPNVGYSEWLGVGMGLHDEYSGDLLGLEIFDNWSSDGEKYPGFTVVKKHWNSFTTGGGRTFGSVRKMAKDAGADLAKINTKYDNVAYISKIDFDDVSDTDNVIGNLDELPPVDVDILALPGIAGQICEYIRLKSKRERPELYPLAALQLMALTGSERKNYFDVKFNLITLGIAPTSGGKEAPQRDVKTLSHSVNNSEYIHGEIGSFKDMVMNLIEYKGKSLYVIDEVHSLFKAMNNKNAHTYETKIEAEILKMSETQLYTFRGMDKLKLAEEKKDKAAWAEKKIAESAGDTKKVEKFERIRDRFFKEAEYMVKGWPDPFFSFMGHSTPDNVDDFLSNRKNIGSGFLPRMLIRRCPETREPLKRRRNQPVDHQLHLATLADSITHTLEKIQSDKRLVTPTEEAEDFIEKCIDWYDAEDQRNNKVLGDMYCRAPAHLYKVSSILGLDGGTITLEHAKYAHAIVQASMDDVKYLILKSYASQGNAAEATVIKNAKETVLRNCKGLGLPISKVVEFIKSSSGISQLQAKNGKRKIPQEVIDSLVASNHLEYQASGKRKRYVTT